MATTDERLLILKTEFRTELKHLVTKADFQTLETCPHPVKVRRHELV